MIGFSTIVPKASVFVPVLEQTFVAAILSWVDWALYRASRDSRTSRADAVLLDLIFGLLTVAVVVICFSVFLRLWQELWYWLLRSVTQNYLDASGNSLAPHDLGEWRVKTVISGLHRKRRRRFTNPSPRLVYRIMPPTS